MRLGFPSSFHQVRANKGELEWLHMSSFKLKSLIGRFMEYLKESPGVIANYGGRYMARGGERIMLEAGDGAKRIVIIEFPSLQKAREWYDSDEYQRIKSLRQGAAVGSIIAIDGC
jgi:uncharacterized protein (DUF1330 family)